jgi:hypothetical protein
MTSTIINNSDTLNLENIYVIFSHKEFSCIWLNIPVVRVYCSNQSSGMISEQFKQEKRLN